LRRGDGGRRWPTRRASQTGLDRARTESIVNEALKGADDGELYLEYSQSEAFVFDDNRLKTASYNIEQGFGLRAVVGESTGYAHSSDLSEEALKRSAAAVQAVKTGRAGAHQSEALP
jgi:TldD protein